mmetsp:Transcript_12484/g.41122  ORF Transcript_12484/g.41122 Transcript_12484/m.41122 type:complete len:201 (+) Transcript_12484:511-1113(+)
MTGAGPPALPRRMRARSGAGSGAGVSSAPGANSSGITGVGPPALPRRRRWGTRGAGGASASSSAGPAPALGSDITGFGPPALPRRPRLCIASILASSESASTGGSASTGAGTPALPRRLRGGGAPRGGHCPPPSSVAPLMGTDTLDLRPIAPCGGSDSETRLPVSERLGAAVSPVPSSDMRGSSHPSGRLAWKRRHMSRK